MGFSQPPIPPRYPGLLFPQGYDPTAAAALETIRASGQPTPDPRFAAGTVRPDEIGVMPPGWRGGPHAVGPLDALKSLAPDALEAIRTLPQTLNPFEQGKATAETVRRLNAAGHPVLGFGAMALGLGAPEMEGVGPELSRATRPAIEDLGHAAEGNLPWGKVPQSAIVSASLGHLSPAENAARHEAMSELLKSWGIDHVEVQGRWKNPATSKWETEKSFLIPGMERAQAVHLGDHFGQHSVITVGGREPGLHDIATGKTQTMIGVREADKGEAHTVLPNGKTVAFDFPGAGSQTGTPTPKPLAKMALPELGDVATSYRQQAGLQGQRLPRVTAVNPEKGRAMAQAYDALKSDPQNPQVQAAYKAFTDETHAQAEHLKANGYSWEYVDKDPYHSSKEMLADLRDKHIKVLRTAPDQAHPLMTPAQNDEFRAVHDILGHGAEGNNFAGWGEENAFRAHQPMYSPLAQRAMATETRGQNSWFNFGPHADVPAPKRPFAEQKAALWPLEHMGGYPGEEPGSRLPPGAPEVLGASDPKYAYRTPATYHGTHSEGFAVPTQSSDIGPHTGTKEQAESLLRQKESIGMASPEEGRILRLYSGVKSPLRITSDLGTWNPVEVAEHLAEHPELKGTPAGDAFAQIGRSARKDFYAIAHGDPDMSPNEWALARSRYNGGWLNEIRNTLKAHGYDAIEYPNSFEGKPSHIINTSTGEVRPYRGGTAKGVDMGYPERAFSDFSTIHLDPTKTLATRPTLRGMTIPQEDVPGLAMGVAHLGAGTKSPQDFAAAVSKVHPELGAQMRASPWLANKMYGTAQKYRGLIGKMPSTEKAVADARSPQGQAIQRWYNETDRTLQNAGLSEKERDVFHKIGAISSIQKSPKDELTRALPAFDAWRHGESPDIPGYTKVQQRMLKNIFADQPWSAVTKGPKVSGYTLARSGQPEGLAIDRHIAEYYTGKQSLNETEHGIVEGRLRHDAAAAGMTPREFQAAVWGAKTGYEPGFGQAGATLEDWLRYHLASGRHERLLETYPGLQKLAEEGAMKSESALPRKQLDFDF